MRRESRLVCDVDGCENKSWNEEFATFWFSTTPQTHRQRLHFCREHFQEFRDQFGIDIKPYHWELRDLSDGSAP